MTDELTTQSYWENSYGEIEFVEYPTRNAHFDLLFSHIDPAHIKSVIEIGSYPGPFLAAMGRYGFELNGVDFHPENATALPAWLRSQGFQVGELVAQDFLTCRIQRKYDLVYSLGFIEHFNNFDEVILRHAELVSPGGCLFLSTPNFRGAIQQGLHRLLDSESLKVHDLAAMDPHLWASLLEKHGFAIRYAGFYGGPVFWVDPSTPKSRLTTLAARFVSRVFYNWRKIYSKESKHFSAFCGLIATKVR